jgi:hypothetical protein
MGFITDQRASSLLQSPNGACIREGLASYLVPFGTQNGVASVLTCQIPPHLI